MIYKLFNNIVPVNGSVRGMLYDLEKNEIIPLPNEVIQLLKQNFFSINDFTKISTIVDKEIMLEYFTYLKDKEIIFEVEENEIDFFPEMSFDWDFPSLITNCIIEYSDKSPFSINEVIKQIENVGCQYFQIYLDVQNLLFSLVALKAYLTESSIQNIDLILHHSQVKNALSFFSQSKKVRTIIAYGYSENMNEINQDVLIRYIINKPNLTYPESTSKDNLVSNLLTFSESQKHHTYFNRKLHIGNQGEMKNAPECTETFGEITSIQGSEELKQIINSSNFQKYWFVSKDKCDICRDCEFRYLCLDSRLPLKRKNKDEWYFEKNCNYNPYISKWRTDDDHLSLDECGIISDKNGLIIDKYRLEAAINKLWST